MPRQEVADDPLVVSNMFQPGGDHPYHTTENDHLGMALGGFGMLWGYEPPSSRTEVTYEHSGLIVQDPGATRTYLEVRNIFPNPVPTTPLDTMSLSSLSRLTQRQVDKYIYIYIDG